MLLVSDTLLKLASLPFEKMCDFLVSKLDSLETGSCC